MSAPISAIEISHAIDIALLVMLIALAAAIVLTRKLLAAILFMSVYSLISAVWFVVLDAPDVAFTEAVVGAGVSTIVLLGAILLARAEEEKVSWGRKVVPAFCAIAVGGLLIYAAFDLPSFGDPSSPANAYVGRAYLETAPGEVGAPNIVTAVLASYRGFDTLGESVVIFAAGLGAALLLGFGDKASVQTVDRKPGEHHVVLRVAARLLIPIIALFVFYVQFHGDLGPGGGFQAGVILAAGVILHSLVFGLRDAMAAAPRTLARSVAATGVLVYAGVGVLCIVNGGNFLDYDYLFRPEIEALIPDWLLGDPGHPHHWGQHFGIFLVELGVLFTVAPTMITIFYGFAGRAPGDTGDLELVDFIEDRKR